MVLKGRHSYFLVKDMLMPASFLNLCFYFDIGCEKGKTVLRGYLSYNPDTYLAPSPLYLCTHTHTHVSIVKKIVVIMMK